MSKNALGRGLGSLMGGEKVVGKETPPLDETAPASPAHAQEEPMASSPAASTPGVGSLLHGVRKEKNLFAPPPAPVEPVSKLEQVARKPIIPRWYFFAADVVLLGVAVGVFLKSPRPMGVSETIFCGIAVLLAGVLGAIGVWMGREDN